MAKFSTNKNINYYYHSTFENMLYPVENILYPFRRCGRDSGENQVKYENQALELLKSEGFNPNIRDQYGPLLHAVYRSGNILVLEELLKHPDIDVEVEDAYGKTIMNLIIAYNNEYVYTILKKHKKVHKKYKSCIIW